MTQAVQIATTADEIANMLGSKRLLGDWEALRDFVDIRTGGELETFALDMLTDAVERRAKAIWA